MSMKLCGIIEWPAKLEIHISTKHLGQRAIKAIDLHAERCEWPVAVIQVDERDMVKNYFYQRRWIRPQNQTSLEDAVQAIVKHSKVDVRVPDLFTFIVKQGQ